MAMKYVPNYIAISVPAPWKVLIEQYLGYQYAAGLSQTTIDTRKQHLQFLARHINYSPGGVTGDILIEWIAKQDWKPESRRGRNNSYRLFWRWAAHRKFLKDIGAELPRVRPGEGIPRPAPDKIYLKAIMQADVRTHLILRLAGECGLRRSEIAVIHSNDLIDDLVGWSLLVHGKGRKKRIVPLTDRVAALLLTLDDGYVFPGKIDGHLSPRRVGELATEVLEGHWTLHTLRHRFATKTYSIDYDVFAVQDLLGHASAETTRRYVQRDRSKLRSLIELAAS